MHSACVCILSFVLSISGILLVIVSSTLILICGNGEVMYSSCVCILSHIIILSDINVHLVIV